METKALFEQIREGHKKYPPTIYELMILKILDNSFTELERQCDMGIKACNSVKILQNLFNGVPVEQILKEAEEHKK